MTRKEHCMLNHHNATVNCIEFTVGNTHVISGSTDGVMSIVRVGNWQLEKLWEKPHKGSTMLSIAVHPTGKLALTLGTDCTLRTWNLIKGRQAYAINLSSKSTDARSLDFIKWGPGGEKFVLGGGANVELWNISTGGIINKYQYKSKVTCVCWLNEEVVAVGHEDGKITVLNVKTQEEEAFEAHTMRVKCLQSSDNWLVSASSDGHIKLWTFDGESIEQVGDCSTGCRCTSLTLVSALKLKEEKQNKQKESSPNKNAGQTSNEEDSEIEEEIPKTTNSKQILKTDEGCKVVIEQENDDESEEEKTITKKRKTASKKNNQKQKKIKRNKKQTWAEENTK